MCYDKYSYNVPWKFLVVYFNACDLVCDTIVSIVLFDFIPMYPLLVWLEVDSISNSFAFFPLHLLLNKTLSWWVLE